jgi:hypothetical protein
MPCKKCAEDFVALQTKLEKSRGAKKKLLDKQKRIGVAMKEAAKVRSYFTPLRFA